MTYPPSGKWTPGPDRCKDTRRDKSKVRRFHRKFDNGKPRRPVTGYDVYYRNTYPEVRTARPDLKPHEVFSEVARLWRECTVWEDRQICYDFADWEKETYYRKMQEWRRRRRHQQLQEEQKLLPASFSKVANDGQNEAG